MKHFMILWVVLSIVACHHSMPPWPSDNDRQDVAMYVRTRSLSGISTLPTAYQFFVHDKSQGCVKRYDINAESDDQNQLHVKLFPGNYTGYCVTHAEAAEAWDYAENSPPDQIFLKSQKTTTSHEEAQDHLLGQAEFEVNENGGTAIFDLNRKVAMLKVIIENIPEWLNDLQIHVSGVSQKMNLIGEYTGDYTITKKISIPDENGLSATSILFFPPKDKAKITLSSESMVFITPEHIIKSILANHITEIKATFRATLESPQVDITTRLVDWNDETIKEADWEVDLPEGPCQGSGNGINLVTNGNFEDNEANNVPAYWKSDVSSKDYTPKATLVTSPVYEGQKAVCIAGKTYLYQDVSIIGGQCYQLNMFVNAPDEKTKWRCWCTWMNGSTNLSSDALHSSSFQYQTNGYIDVFDGQTFRAPANATKIRMEIRAYMDPVEGQGLYVDAISVEKVD